MVDKRRWDNIRVGDLLRADTFGQQIYIMDPSTKQSEPLIINHTHFFVDVFCNYDDTKRIKVLNGINGDTNPSDIISVDEWYEEIDNAENSLVYFIEGYAGCGKSVFVQKTLSKLIGRYEYSYNYFNYDIGADFESKTCDKIKNSILLRFLDRLSRLIIDKKTNVVDKFNELMANKDNICYLDHNRDIYLKFVDTDKYAYELNRLKTSGGHKSERVNNFIKPLIKQVEKSNFTLGQILSLDCVLRLSEYICGDDFNNNGIYICYDNLDSVEDFEELNLFYNHLAYMRQKIDAYILHSKQNYNNALEPHFVFFATTRKITISRVREVISDSLAHDQNVHRIDVSGINDFRKLVCKRVDFFKEYITHYAPQYAGHYVAELKVLLEKAKKITEMEFIRKQYSQLWNYNYWVCCSILQRVIHDFKDDVFECIRYFDKGNDGDSEQEFSYSGASAIFLSLIYKLFNKSGIWGVDYLNLPELGKLAESDRIERYASLSRLILTYMCRSKDAQGHDRPVTVKEIFEVFSPLYDSKDICSSLANMVSRENTGTWRRQIHYYKHPIAENRKPYDALKEQFEEFKTSPSHSYPYTEFLLCESGRFFVERIVSDFEYYANRLSIDNKALYLLTDIDEMNKGITDVCDAVECSCKNLKKFDETYRNKCDIELVDYLKLPIHPQTKESNPQLHAERIIFTHIAYLEHFHSDMMKSRPELDKNAINDLIVTSITRYLELYDVYIVPVSLQRKNRAEEIQKRIRKYKKAK